MTEDQLHGGLAAITMVVGRPIYRPLNLIKASLVRPVKGRKRQTEIVDVDASSNLRYDVKSV